MSELNLLPDELNLKVLAGDDLILTVTFEQAGSCDGSLPVNLTGANITATIYWGNTTVAGNLTTANAANGVIGVLWNQTQTTTLANTTNPWYLQVSQSGYEWTPIAGNVEVVRRG